MNLLIDGSNLLHRSFWVAEKTTQKQDVDESDVLFLFLKSIKSLVQKFKPDNVWVAWDKRLTHNSTNFRKQLIPDEYKATRDLDRNKKVINNHKCVEEALICLGIKQMYPNVLEADDIISWLSHQNNDKSTIVSVDKDLLQLVNTNINVFNPIRKILITVDNFKSVAGIELEHFLKFKALLGDTSDNIQGVEGYGVQRSKKLCTEEVDIIKQTLLQDKFNVFLKNIKLMSLKNSTQFQEGEEECYKSQYVEQLHIRSNFKAFEKLCIMYNFQSFIKDIASWKRTFKTEHNMCNLIDRLKLI